MPVNRLTVQELLCHHRHPGRPLSRGRGQSKIQHDLWPLPQCGLALGIGGWGGGGCMCVCMYLNLGVCIWHFVHKIVRMHFYLYIFWETFLLYFPDLWKHFCFVLFAASATTCFFDLPPLCSLFPLLTANKLASTVWWKKKPRIINRRHFFPHPPLSLQLCPATRAGIPDSYSTVTSRGPRSTLATRSATAVMRATCWKVTRPCRAWPRQREPLPGTFLCPTAEVSCGRTR